MISTRRLSALLLIGVWVAACSGRIAPDELGTGARLDRQIVAWCENLPNRSDASCRCWPGALRREGLSDQDLQDLLIWAGAVSDTQGWGVRDPAAVERATVACGP